MLHTGIDKLQNFTSCQDSAKIIKSKFFLWISFPEIAKIHQNLAIAIII